MILDDLNIDEATEYVYSELFEEKKEKGCRVLTTKTQQPTENITISRIAQKGTEVK